MVRLDVEQVDARTVLVRLGGDLDQGNSVGLTEAVEQCLAAPGTMVLLDCADLQFCDSSGLTALLLADRTATALGCVLHLTGLDPALLHLLDLTGLDQVLSVHPGPLADPAATGAQVTGTIETSREVSTAPVGPGAVPPYPAGPVRDVDAEQPTGPRDLLRALTGVHEAGRRGRREAREAARAKVAFAAGAARSASGGPAGPRPPGDAELCP